jgi:hypothetical protein
MRDLLIIGGISVTAILVGTLLFFFGPASLQTDFNSALSSTINTNNPSVTYTTLAKGSRALSITDRTNYRLTSSADLGALWPMIYGDAAAPAVPDVDFSKYEVLAFFDGSHSSDGYDISVSGIADSKASRSVGVTHILPGPKCRVSSKSTSPFVVLQVPKTPYTLTHQDLKTTNPCI